MASNILLHLAPQAVTVTFGDSTYVIPPMSAYDWCVVLLAVPFDPYGVFPELAGQTAAKDVEDAVDRKVITHDDLSRAALDVVTTAGDRNWWEVLRILATAGSAWDRIGSTLLREGVDPHQVSLAAWINAIWSVLLLYVDPAKKAMFMSQIEKTPPGWDAAVDWDDDQEVLLQEQAFLAAMQAARP